MNARNGIIAGILLLGAALLAAFAAGFRKGNGGQESGGEPASPPPAEFAAHPVPMEIRVELAAKNPFHPLRGAPPPEAKKEIPARNGPPANFTLTGIFGFGGERGAVIASGAPPVGKPGVAPRKIFRTEAEVGGGYVLSEVRADCAVLVRGTDKMILHLYQTQERKMRERKP